MSAFILTTAADQTSGNGYHHTPRNTPLCWPDPVAQALWWRWRQKPLQLLKQKQLQGHRMLCRAQPPHWAVILLKEGCYFFFFGHSCTSTESIRQPEDFQHISRLLNSELLLTLLSSRYSNPHLVLPLLFYNPSINFSWEFPFSRICPTLSITTSFHQDFSYTSPHQSASQYQTSNPKFQLCLHWNKPFCEKQGASPARAPRDHPARQEKNENSVFNTIYSKLTVCYFTSHISKLLIWKI